jgi:transcription elongation factor Elf1
MALKTVCTHCNQPYTLTDDKQGKTVRCKGCGSTFVVRAAEILEEVDDDAEAIGTEPRPRAARSRREEPEDRPARRRPRDDDGDDGDERRPRRRRRGIPVWVWLASGGGLLLIVAVVLVAILLGTGVIGPNRVTKENFDKLHAGMSEDQVISILGRKDMRDGFGNPVKIDESNYLRTLIWEKEGKRIEVDVINRRVENPPRWIVLPSGAAAAEGGGQAAAPVGGPPTPPLTSALAQRVMGKTEAEVIQILGQPTKKLGPRPMGNPRAPSSTDTWRWVQGRASLDVYFVNGKVTGWHGSNIP